MPGPVQAAGAQSSPTRYGALAMAGEQFTGIWTQRSPYRDAATAYLVKKFYQGSRFDSILDGINREISARLTDARRPGCPAFGTSSLPQKAQSFYSFKSVGALTNAEKCQIMADTAAGVYDITGGLNYKFLSKTTTAKMRFLGLLQSLFMTDGVEQKKLLSPGPWVASTSVQPGTLINNTAYNETSQIILMALGGIQMTIIGIASSGTVITVYIDPEDVPDQFANLVGVSVAFSGLTTATYLNGNSYAVASIVSSTLGIFTITLSHTSAPFASDTGTASTGNGTTGSTQPSWTPTQFAVTADSGQQWKSYGSSVENWGLQVPVNAPTLTPENGTRFWQPSTTYPAGYAILDNNGDVEVGSGGESGVNYPTWAALIQNAEAAIVSATQNTNLAGSRSIDALTNPYTTPPTGGAIYQNTSGVAMIVVVSMDLGGGGFGAAVYCDSSSSPTTQVAQFGRVNAGSSSPNFYPSSVTFIVPPGFYYGISTTSGSGTPTIRTWTEYLMNGAQASSGSGASAVAGGPSTTVDGSITWTNYGKPGTWYASTGYAGPWNLVSPVGVILDSNGNWQYVTAGAGGLSGGSVPSWATGIGSTTSDGALTWTCLGPGTILTTAAVQYAFSTHAIDGSVSTASPASTIYGGIVGPAAALGQSYIQLGGAWIQDAQIDQLWIWRTPQGQATPIQEDQIPVDPYYSASAFTYQELGIPDTSTNGGGALDALIAAPVASSNNPPPATMTAPTYHVGRVFAISQGKVIYSGGPDTVVGNGNTAFPPNNYQFTPAQPVRLVPVTVQNGALLIYTTSGVQILFGTGTSSNPFYITSYYDKVNLASYDALDTWGTTHFLMESNGKVSALAVQYPFNPSTGYTEIGFPIGDQFVNTTTGGNPGAIYNPATSFLSWNIANSMDTAMYVADGSVGWFRMSAVSPPESGYMWSPRAAIAAGTSAVQSIETSPGSFTLLIGPPSGGGAVLMRDTTGTVWGDGSGNTAFDAWDAKGVNLLCSTGQWTEVAHISAKSTAVGARPVVSVILNEIEALPAQGRPWNVLEITGQDPARGQRSKSVFSDRYALAQNGVDDLGDCILTKFDYGSQTVGDELLDWGIFASTDEERKEEAAQAR